MASENAAITPDTLNPAGTNNSKMTFTYGDPTDQITTISDHTVSASGTNEAQQVSSTTTLYDYNDVTSTPIVTFDSTSNLTANANHYTSSGTNTEMLPDGTVVSDTTVHQTAFVGADGQQFNYVSKDNLTGTVTHVNSHTM